MRAAKNDEIESDVYDEFLALDMTDKKNSKNIIMVMQKQLKEN